jgi:predicted NUDIX family NTP pyrophosphohydrolase
VISAGILLYRRIGGTVEVLLAHPGGPFWARRDEGAWSIPKGEAGESEELLEVALREFEEEVGIPVMCHGSLPLGSVTQRSGKVVHGWACEGDVDPAEQRSNFFSMEWPPRSGGIQEFLEVDRVEWFAAETARRKLNPAQAAFVDRLLEALDKPVT